MYLTKISPIEINGDYYIIHQKLRNLFEKPEKFLFQTNNNNITVLSNIPPNKKIGTSKHINIDEYCIKDDQHIFSTRLNSCFRDNKTKKYKPIPIDELKYWIQLKLNNIGISELNFHYQFEGNKNFIKKEQTMSLYTVFINGYFTIYDPARFKEILINGIPGKYKHLGCGLLNVFI